MVGVAGGGWSLALGVEWDVVKSVVVLRRGWLVLRRRMESGVGCSVGCC